MREFLIEGAYLTASVLFILCLAALSSPKKARRGVLLGEVGMFVAVVGTLLHHEIIRFEWIIAGLAIGSVIGASMAAWIPMTKMPERIALSHSFGGLAAGLVGISEYYRHDGKLSSFVMAAVGFEVFLGLLTFTGSLMAFAKLQGVLRGAPITYLGQNKLNGLLFVGALGLWGWLAVQPTQPAAFYTLAVLGFGLGILFVLPIGGADMPVVISLLNSYAGLAASATGFALGNRLLIIAGALDGASGFLLSMMMSKAMNRSFSNVLFGAFGSNAGASTSAGVGASAGGSQKAIHEGSVDDAAEALAAAQSVIVVPGYGMAVSQAQHALRDLAEALEKNGCTVKYAIHPVAGRMPGHMNVLLAEANIPYDQIFDISEINDEFPRTDVVLVVGANDVVNPAAKHNRSSPIYGMPIFDVERARMVIVLKRGLGSGFSGIENDLFTLPTTMMVLGDARKTLLALGAAVTAD
jgi:NAD(P) transhydrogenase subunit beta